MASAVPTLVAPKLVSVPLEVVSVVPVDPATVSTPVTAVSVPAQVSVIVHFVPRTVAELLRPRVLNLPRALPNSFRLRFRAAEPPRGTQWSRS